MTAIGPPRSRWGPTDDSPVQVDDLRKTYGSGVEALKGISFSVAEGEIFGLLGPNGAGKTTTVGVLTTTVRASGGTALVAGHDVARDPLAVRAAIGVVFQESVLDNDFSARANLALHAHLWRMPPRLAHTRIEILLEAMGLSHRSDYGVRTYSGGMRRRLEIARALLAEPKVVFLDEPTLGLDPAVRRDLWELIEDLRRREGSTILVSTHYLEEAEAVCNRVGVMHRGELVALGSPAALIAQLGREMLELRVEGDRDRVTQTLASSGIGSAPPIVSGDKVFLPLDAPSAAITHHINELRARGVGIIGTTVRRTTLNDVYLQLTSDARSRVEKNRILR